MGSDMVKNDRTRRSKDDHVDQATTDLLVTKVLYCISRPACRPADRPITLPTNRPRKRPADFLLAPTDWRTARTVCQSQKAHILPLHGNRLDRHSVLRPIVTP